MMLCFVEVVLMTTITMAISMSTPDPKLDSKSCSEMTDAATLMTSATTVAASGERAEADLAEYQPLTDM